MCAGWPGSKRNGGTQVDDRIKAKALMAGGLFILAIIGLVIVLVVLPGIREGTGSHSALAQEGEMPPSMPMDPGMMEGGGMEGMGPGMGGMPGMPGGAPGGARAAGAQPAAEPARVVEPLEESRPNPFAPFAGVGLVSERLPSGLAFSPSYHTMPIGIREQNQFPGVGPQGQTIKVPKGLPSRRPGGPEAPPRQEWMRVAGVLYDPNGKAMVILQAGRGEEQGAVLQVGDRFHGWRVEAITRNQMVLAKEEDGKVERRIIHLQQGGGARRPTAGGARRPAGGTGAGAPRPGVAVPGARGGSEQPGIRRPGAARPGAFPGVGAGRRPGARPEPQQE